MANDRRPPIPGAKKDDAEDVSWALSTAEAMWSRGEHQDAVKWIRRAAEAASEAQADDRALELAKAAAELTSQVGMRAAPASQAPPPPPVPSRPPPLPPRAGGSGPPRSASTPPKPSTPPKSTSSPPKSIPAPAPPGARLSQPPRPTPSAPIVAASAAAMKPVAATAPRTPAPPKTAAAPRPPIVATTTGLPRSASGAPLPPKMREEATITKTEPRRGKRSSSHDLTRPPLVRPAPDNEVTQQVAVPRRRRSSKPAPAEVAPPVPPVSQAPTVDQATTEEMDGWPTLISSTEAMQEHAPAHEEKTRIGAPAYVAEATQAAEAPPPVAPEDAYGRPLQALRVVIWRSSDGLRIAPQGATPPGMSIEAMLVALDPAADLTEWLKR